MIAIDTHLLVYAHRAAAPQHVAACRAVERAMDDARGCGISMPCLAEFWSVVTHPSSAGGPSTPALAAKFIRSLVDEAAVQLWLPGSGWAELFLKAANELQLSGPRVFDLQIGLIALENGAEEIWTNDQRFVRLRGLKVFDPLQ